MTQHEIFWAITAPVSRMTYKKLGVKVFAVYDWKFDLSDEEILEKLLALNFERSNND